MALQTAVAQAEVVFADAIKIKQTITEWCFLQAILF